ncbi:MAG: hypothetical protein AAF681_01395 [Pseudomonadota bacterium]
MSDVIGLDENWCYDDTETVLTPRLSVSHLALTNKVDPVHPVLMSAEGRLIDGVRGIVKAVAEGLRHLTTVYFARTADPDFVNLSLGDLP